MIPAVMLLAAAVAWCSLHGPADQAARIPWPAALALLAATPLYAAFVSWWTVRLLRQDARRALHGVRYYRRARTIHAVLWIVSVLSLIRWWPSAVGSSIAVPLVQELIEWLPVWGTYLVSCLAFYPVEKGMVRWNPNGRDFPGAAAYLATRLRHDLLLWMLPAFLCVLAWRYVPSGALSTLERHPLLGTAAVIFALWFCTPRLVLCLVGARRLPDPALRQTLQNMADRWGVTLTDVRLWPTGNSIINAAAVGFWPRRGTLLLTDRLIAQASPVEITALAAHEIAHIRRYHLLLRLAVVGLPLGTSLALNGAVGWQDLSQVWLTVAAVTGTLLLASTVARWTEYDADRWAQSKLAEEEADVDLGATLRSLASANPSARRGGYLHPPLAKRLEALQP